MIRRRDVASLGGLSVVLTAATLGAVAFVIGASERLERFYESTDAYAGARQEMLLIQVSTEAAARMLPWLTLAALVPAIAALALASWRAREPAGAAAPNG